MERTARRYQETISRVVYIRDSVLRRRDVTGAFNMQIGLGLFARTSFREGEKIVFSLESCFSTWMSSMERDLDTSRIYFIQRRQMSMGLVNGWIASRQDLKINV